MSHISIFIDRHLRDIKWMNYAKWQYFFKIIDRTDIKSFSVRRLRPVFR